MWLNKLEAVMLPVICFAWELEVVQFLAVSPETLPEAYYVGVNKRKLIMNSVYVQTEMQRNNSR